MKKSDRPRRVKPQRSLARLDALAARRWRNGDPHGAERALRELVRRGRRGRRVQLAYGDLFVLVRETHGRAAEPALWREYLKRFPRGPHADDARAGLCRRAAEGERARCWRAYVDAFPSGAHVGVAARALAHASSRDRSRQRQ